MTKSESPLKNACLCLYWCKDLCLLIKQTDRQTGGCYDSWEDVSDTIVKNSCSLQKKTEDWTKTSIIE